MYAMHSLFCSAEIKVSFAIGLNSTFSLEALSTMKDIVLSVLQGKFSISYLCNRNSMNAMNNEIFYAESVITSLKASCCFPLVITCRFHSVTARLPTIIIVSITVLKVLPNTQPVQWWQPVPLAGWGKQGELSCLGSICWMLTIKP